MIRLYKKRTEMTREELIEHKRKLKHQQNINYYKNKKQKHHQAIINKTNTNNYNDDGLYNMLIGLYELLTGLTELCSISQDDNTIDDRIDETEDSIIELEEQLNIPLEDRLLYHLYNEYTDEDDEDDED